MQTFRKIIWLLLFLTVLLFAFAHPLMVLLMTMPKEGEGSDAFSRFDKAAKNQWSGVLGNFDSLKPWEGNFWVDTSIIVFSLFSTIITLNILSMYSQIFFVFSYDFLIFFFFDSCTCE